MKLSTTGISVIRGNKILRAAIMAELGVSKSSMYRYIYYNDPVLTQASVLKIIREETGLGDHEILEPAQAEKEPQS